MKTLTKKIVGVSALGVLTLVELVQLQQANATPVTFTGTLQPDGGFGGNVQVAISVDGSSGTYKITGITTPIQPSGVNGLYANSAIPTLVSEALAAQSASISGVSGASSISAAWIQSLAGAIAAAAAAGERIGSPVSLTTPTPTPTPTVTTPAPTPKPTIGAVDPDAAVLAKLVAAGTITQAQSTVILAALQAAHAVHPKITGGDDANEGVHAEGAAANKGTPVVKVPFTKSGLKHRGFNH